MTMRRPTSHFLVLSILAVLAAAFLAACGGGTSDGASPVAPGSTAPSGENVAVAIEDYAYSPSPLTISPGTTVIWTNKDSASHTVTSADGPSTDAETTGLFDSGMMSKGNTFSYTFTEAGTYNYLCTPHRSMASMHAVVIVQ